LINNTLIKQEGIPKKQLPSLKTLEEKYAGGTEQPLAKPSPEPIIQPESTPPTPNQPMEDEESFFSELQEDITKEIGNLNKLETWYNNKFLPRDVVTEMKNYWEKQKGNSIIKILGKNFQERISEKTANLQNLEKEWQNIYFDLIEKEEEIRDQERELKKLLAEFVEVCKRKTKKDDK